MVMEELQEAVFIPLEVKKEAQAACYKLLPKKSKDNYDKEFRHFEEWRKQQSITGINEEVMLAYFHIYRRKIAPSSLWTKYSMLRSTLKVYMNSDISKYGKLISYLKSEARTHKSKKAKILERLHIEKFLNEAPNNKYLMMKVALIMGISGACRCDEITKLKVDDIEDKGGYLYVSIPDTKTNVSRSFTVMAEGFTTDILDLYRKYVCMRPKGIPHGRFFLNYKKEKCTIQPVGINTISKIPQKVASFLNLPEAQLYTGHSLRRSSASLLANAGADITTVKRHGGWKSSTVAEGYIQDSVSNKIDIARKIQGPDSLTSSTSGHQISVQDTSNTSSSITLNSNNLNAESDTKRISFNFNINVNVN